ncbi:MAG: hypothetical protein SOH70_03980 [Lentilactobacillus sunkii]|jgi:hypothetical protein|uniref:hypothetical protein n=1 Tax=Lentilactobacillus sunkii TaxID=481719 RepID=UPI002F35EF42
MNAKQRKIIRKAVNEMLKKDGANIAISPETSQLTNERIIKMTFYNIDVLGAMQVFEHLPQGIDFDRIH